MKKPFTYKQVLATCFLMLYIFIATPVQLWHHHSFFKQKTFSLKKSVDADTKSEECKICQHTYAAYVNDDVHCTIALKIVLSDNNSFFVTDYAEPSIQDASNKSPPHV